jgi:cytoskeleton protein RodZ
MPVAAERPEAPPSQNIPFPGKAPQRWPLYAAVAVAIVALLAVYEFYWSENEAVVVRQAAEATPPASPRTAPVLAKASDAGPPAAATAVAGAGTDPQGIVVAAAGPATGEAPAADVPGAPGAARHGERVVRLVFDEESWVEIRDRSGGAIFTQLNSPGTVQEVRGVPPLAVVVGNAHGVRMTYDDQPVDLARHTKVDVARLTLE